MLAVDERDDDRALTQAWQRGDACAGKLLVERHFDAVYRFFARRLPPQDALDLVQITFEAYLAKRDSPVHTSVRTYLLGTAHKQLLMHLRYRNVRKGEVACGSLRERFADSVPRVSAAVAGAERREMIRGAVDSLPLDMKIAVELYYWEELSIREISHVLGVPIGTIKTRLLSARRQLSSKLGKSVPEGSR